MASGAPRGHITTGIFSTNKVTSCCSKLKMSIFGIHRVNKGCIGGLDTVFRPRDCNHRNHGYLWSPPAEQERLSCTHQNKATRSFQPSTDLWETERQMSSKLSYYNQVKKGRLMSNTKLSPIWLVLKIIDASCG